MNNDYIAVLVQSLQKKVAILDKIVEMNLLQKELLQREIFEQEKFEESISEKSKLIEELNFLDAGFTEVYNRVKDDLTLNKNQYTDQIKLMKSLIQIITDKSVSIRVEEERTKVLAGKKFAMLKQDIKKRRVSNRAVNEYYKRMSNSKYVEAQFMDQKK